MRWRFVKGVVIIMAFCLIGLIWIQVKLVRKAMKSVEEEWDTQTYNMLSKVTSQIEERETMVLFSAFLRSQPIGLIRDQEGKVGTQLNYDSLDVQYDRSGQKVRLFTGARPEAKIDTTGHSMNLSDNMDVSLSFSEGKLNMNPALTRSLINRFTAVYELKARIEKMRIDSLLKEELSLQQTELAFNFWITDLAGNLVAGDSLTSDAGAAGLYKHKLFPSGDLKGQNGFLWLNFPGRERYIYASSALSITMSALFILVIILIFWITLRNLLKQKRLSQVKTDFINQMTHEFKTPIATIALAADSLNNSKVNRDPEQIAMYGRIIKEESSRMNRQVESVLEVAQLNREEVKLRLERLNMNTIVDCAIEMVKLRLSKREGTIQFKRLTTPVFVSGDQQYLESVVVNLLDNAIKYCVKKPVIEIELTTEAGFVKLSVSDNGIGIDQEYQEKIFEKFYRIPSENSDYISGSGLGLSYVRSVLDLHQALIFVEKRIGAGSVFKISLPQIDE